MGCGTWAVARMWHAASRLPSERRRPRGPKSELTWAFVVERVTRVELAFSAWESTSARMDGRVRPSVAVVTRQSIQRTVADGHTRGMIAGWPRRSGHEPCIRVANVAQRVGAEFQAATRHRTAAGP